MRVIFNAEIESRFGRSGFWIFGMGLCPRLEFEIAPSALKRFRPDPR
jgi:hypothetical protein